MASLGAALYPICQPIAVTPGHDTVSALLDITRRLGANGSTG